jgi:polyisoprenoid-binding protein YceI
MKPLALTALTAAVLPALLAASPATAAPYVLDVTHTFVHYEMPHFGTSTSRGRFQAKEGSLQYEAGKSGRVEVSFDLTAISTGVPALDKHMQAADFFDAAQYPTARFVGDKFSFNGDKVTEVGGQLTLRGKTHPVTLTATRFNCYLNPVLKRQVCGGDFETTIRRSLWGVNWGLADFGFPDAVHLLVQVEAVKQ